MSVSALSVSELAERLKRPHPPTVIDVRESAELEVARIEGAVHMPLGGIERSIRVLDPHMDYVVVCHHGIRSAQAAAVMSAQGFTGVANLTGGIDAWSCEVDPSVPRY
jgi:rhodanese-related sulfurtransferase